MKKILSVLICLVLISCLFGCTKMPKSSKPTVNIATLQGPTGMGMAYMLKNYNYEVCAGPDEITGKLVTGEYDVAALPTNAAATLYNKTGGKVKLLALNTGCVLYVLSKDTNIKSVADLKGKTIYVSGQGSTPEYILNYILVANGLKPGEDVKFDFTYTNHNDLVAFAATGAADVVLLPEPTVTALIAKNADMKVAFSLEDAWKDAVLSTEFEGTKIAMGCLVANSDFLQKNPDAVASLLADYENSIGLVNDESKIDETANLISELGIVPAAGVAKSALPRCNIIYATGNEMKSMVEGFYKVLFDANPASTGGKLPDENFYYGK